MIFIYKMNGDVVEHFRFVEHFTLYPIQFFH